MLPPPSRESSFSESSSSSSALTPKASTPPPQPVVPVVPVATSAAPKLRDLVGRVAQLSRQSEDQPSSARSSRSTFSVQTEVLAEHATEPSGSQGKRQNQPTDVSELKTSLKAFVQGMVRGRDVHMSEEGSVIVRSCKLSKKVDTLILDPKVIPLVEIAHVHRGMEALPLALQIELSPSWIVLDPWSEPTDEFNSPCGDVYQYLRRYIYFFLIYELTS